jgi:hypothetical protein
LRPLQLCTATMACLLAGSLCCLAATQAVAQNIYSCTDGKGRRITADRPIVECMDRTQKQLSSSGMVKRELAPPLTSGERAALERKEKIAAEQKAREAEEKKRDLALQTRYPSRAVHDKERAAALVQVEVVLQASAKRSQELVEQRKAINNDLEFYQATPDRVPAVLRRRLEENDSSVAAQKRFVAEQEAEKKRVNLRFDEELVKLGRFWGVPAASPASPARN